MAVSDVAERGVKTFMDTMREVGTDKAVSEALIGGAGGIGANMAYNVASGDSGGYMGAGILGGAAGGFGRAGLKHFNLETQASNLMSTFKEGAVGQLTKAKTAARSGENGSSTGQKIMYGKEEAPIQDYVGREAAKNREAKSLMDKGYDTQSKQASAEANSLGIRRKEKETNQYNDYKKNMTTSELEDRYASQGGAKYIKDNMDSNFTSVADRLKSNTQAAESMTRKKSIDSQKYSVKAQAKATTRRDNKNFTDSLESTKDRAKQKVMEKRDSNKAVHPLVGSKPVASSEKLDDFYDDAVDFMAFNKKASSVAGLQRELKIGYNRANKLMGSLESNGVVSSASKNGKRDLLL